MKTQNNYCRYPWLLWMVREKSGESGTCLFSQLLQWSAVIPNICKLKFVLSGMLGINHRLFLLVPNPPTAWHGSSPLKNQPNGIWDRFLDSPDMSAKSRMIKKQYNRFSQHKKPGLMEVALNTTEILSGKTYEDNRWLLSCMYISWLHKWRSMYHTWLIMSWGIFSFPKCFCANNKENK